MNPLAVKVPPWAREIGKATLKAFAVGLATSGAAQITRRTGEAYERRRVRRDKENGTQDKSGYSVPNNSTPPGTEGAEA